MWTASREAEREAEDREIDTGSLICIESRTDLTTTTIPSHLSRTMSLYIQLSTIFFSIFLLSSYFPARSRRKETFLTIWDYILEQVWNNKVHFPQEEEEKKDDYAGELCGGGIWDIYEKLSHKQTKKSIFLLFLGKKPLPDCTHYLEFFVPSFM